MIYICILVPTGSATACFYSSSLSALSFAPFAPVFVVFVVVVGLRHHRKSALSPHSLHSLHTLQQWRGSRFSFVPLPSLPLYSCVYDRSLYTPSINSQFWLVTTREEKKKFRSATVFFDSSFVLGNSEEEV